MNWIHIWFCTDCQSQIRLGIGNEPDYCECLDDDEDEDRCICIPDEPNPLCESCF